MEAARPLLTGYAGSSSEKVLALITKLFKILSRVAKDFLGTEHLPASFRHLLKASTALKDPAGKLIETLQNQSVRGAKKKKTVIKAKSVVMPRQAKIVPELVFQLEQAEVQLVRLSTRNKTTDVDLAKCLVPREQRSFRIGNGNFNPKEARKRERDEA